MKETQLQKKIKEYLTKRGHWVLRHSTEGRKDPKTGKWRRTSGTVGEADLQVFPKDQVFPIFIEIKTPEGKQSAEQVLFQKKCELWGVEYAVVRSVEDCKALGL